MTSRRCSKTERSRRGTRAPALALLVAVAGPVAAPALAQPATDVKRIIAFGAHPDDCELAAGGVAAKWAALGHKFKCVAVTNGDIGHSVQAGGALARRRRAEVERGARQPRRRAHGHPGEPAHDHEHVRSAAAPDRLHF